MTNLLLLYHRESVSIDKRIHFNVPRVVYANRRSFCEIVRRLHGTSRYSRYVAANLARVTTQRAAQKRVFSPIFSASPVALLFRRILGSYIRISLPFSLCFASFLSTLYVFFIFFFYARICNIDMLRINHNDR